MVITSSGFRGRIKIELVLEHIDLIQLPKTKAPLLPVLCFTKSVTIIQSESTWDPSGSTSKWSGSLHFENRYGLKGGKFNLLHQRSTKLYSKKDRGPVDFWRLIWLNLFAHMRQCRLNITKCVCVSVCWGGGSG